MKTSFPSVATAAFSPSDIGRTGGSDLSWAHFPAGENGFYRAPVLLSGPTEAVLIDGGFNFSDGRALAEAIRKTGKKLTAIYVSQSDPDYYFGLKPVCEAFPEATVIAASETVDAIKGSVEKKLAVWGPQLKDNGPQTISDIVMPEVFDGPALLVDGHRIEIVAADGVPNRRYLWVPSIEAVFGGAMIFSGVHVWTADTQAKELRAAWIANLDKVAARKPAIVVAGHLMTESRTDVSGISHTRAYLMAFEQEVANAVDSADLKARMEVRFPDLGMSVALDIGARVAKGEMKWG